MQKNYKNMHKTFIYIAVIFLVGCASRTPVGPVHLSSKTYFCRGSWHHPQNYYEYDEVGIASWYGDKFHGKAKASGEKFNKMAMTAAHKTLPIPSVVKVTSYKTGKSIVVVVDDRGPFVYKGRIIDLSYNAAKALGIHNMKPSTVRVETLVSDSLRLSQYIAKHCRNNRDINGRSWAEVYFQDINRYNYHQYKEPLINSVHNKKEITKPKFLKKRYNSLGKCLKKI